MVTSEKMQASLELHALLSVFLSQVPQLLQLDGLRFHHEPQNLDMRIGRQASHSCGYRLICGSDALGELVFKRERKFSEHEMETLESVLALLLKPLSNALQYRHAVNAALRDPLTGAANCSD